MHERPQNLRELRECGYPSVSVKTEMRRNLLRMLQAGDELFPGILGYDESVIPQVVNAVLSRHDMLFLGLRGQGKTRMLRMLVNLLDDAIPVVAGSEINDDPFAPISKFARDLVEVKGDDCPIEWVGREQRYHEKLATPDVTIADLVGEIDLIKHAEGRHLASEDVMHFGLIPRSNRGLFCMNELPDLSPKIQVGLFNVLEERDVQIRGFTVRLGLDLCMVFSANPEDYTNRGRIVTPLKDRIGSVVRTHYPLSRELGIEITDANAWMTRDDGVPVAVPAFMKQIVEEFSRLARTSPHVNQASGVSVRMSIANYETMLSNAERRCVLNGDDQTVARISDLSHIAASSRGKMELAMTEETGEEDLLVTRLVDEAVKTVFDEHFQTKQFRDIVAHFESGTQLEIGDAATTADYLQRLDDVPPLAKHANRIAQELEPGLATGSTAPHLVIAITEWILNGLHANNRLNRRDKSGATAFGF